MCGELERELIRYIYRLYIVSLNCEKTVENMNNYKERYIKILCLKKMNRDGNIYSEKMIKRERERENEKSEKRKNVYN